MAQAKRLDVYLIVGKKRTLAGAVEWPGWCRAAKDRDGALAALLASAPRYARILHTAHIAFEPPETLADLKVIAELPGTASTDYGIPDIPPEQDERPLKAADLPEIEALLKVYWKAFGRALKAAEGKTLSVGPRGGGRKLDGIAEHVLGAQASYLSAAGWKFKHPEDEPLAEQLKQTEQAMRDALQAAVAGELPERGPRGGKIWLPRYFVRRSGWHLLDHIWEIEDRAE